MERRAASHTEEEEMNQRRKLLNAAKKGDQKAVGKLFELYQVRIFSGDQVQKLNKAAGLHKLKNKQAPTVKGGKPVPPLKPVAGKKPLPKMAKKMALKAKKKISPPKKKAAPLKKKK